MEFSLTPLGVRGRGTTLIRFLWNLEQKYNRLLQCRRDVQLCKLFEKKNHRNIMDPVSTRLKESRAFLFRFWFVWFVCVISGHGCKEVVLHWIFLQITFLISKPFFFLINRTKKNQILKVKSQMSLLLRRHSNSFYCLLSAGMCKARHSGLSVKSQVCRLCSR